MESFERLLSWELYGNPAEAWLIAVTIALVAFFAASAVKVFIANRLSALAKRTVNTIDDLVADLVRDVHALTLFSITFFTGFITLNFPKGPEELLRAIPILALIFQFGIWGNRVILYLLEKYVSAQKDEDARRVTKTMLGPLKFICYLVLWSMLLLVALDNLGVDVTAMVAGLGVGGIAVALAVQNILGDFMAALSIAIDQPFVVGDFIILSPDHQGTVERIGLKTTRIRSLSGEQLVISNNDLLNSRIRNYKRMFERRVLFRFGVIYQTTAEQLEAIPPMVREIIESQEKVRFDRAHFAAYGNSSLDFEVVYFVLDSEYNVYMDIQQTINLAIFRQFSEKGIDFAYPTRTLYMQKEPDAV